MYKELIKSIRARVVISDKEIALLKGKFTLRKAGKCHFLLNADDVCNHMFFVERGLLRSFTNNSDGSEYTMQSASEGWWISDLGSFLSGDPYQYNIEAFEESEILLLSKPGMEDLMDEIPQIQRYFLDLMQNHIIALQRRGNVVQSMSAEKTYLKLMEIKPAADQPGIAAAYCLFPGNYAGDIEPCSEASI